jgi:hypothetical protein
VVGSEGDEWGLLKDDLKGSAMPVDVCEEWYPPTNIITRLRPPSWKPSEDEISAASKYK